MSKIEIQTFQKDGDRKSPDHLFVKDGAYLMMDGKVVAVIIHCGQTVSVNVGHEFRGSA